MKCVLAAGGTGGHIQPAIALAQRLKALCPEMEILFVGGYRPQERRWIEGAGFPFRPIHCSPASGTLVQKALLPGKVVMGVVECLRLMRRFRPDVVLGFGGYTSFPPLVAGMVLRKPRVLLEQNVIPGRTNRLLSRLATEVHSQWEEARPHFGKKVLVHHTGNPVRPVIRTLAEETGGKRNAILVMGGSQGSSSVNRIFVEVAPRLAGRFPGLEMIHLTGAADESWVRAAYAREGVSAEVYGYLEDMTRAYPRAALAVCRAGGTSIAELLVMGIPSILIPYPHAADDHQTWNAKAVEARGAGIVLPESEATPDRMAGILFDLLSDPSRLDAMQRHAREMGIPDASERILDHLQALFHPREQPNGETV